MTKQVDSEAGILLLVGLFESTISTKVRDIRNVRRVIALQYNRKYQ